ncbi:MAG: TetR/AcrR family transcriptional regulator [Frankia sp.]
MPVEAARGGANTDSGLPPGIELAWGIRERPSRGPKRGLSLDRIVAAGIEVALADGLGSLSMSRVAAQVGASTMSLYRYVAAKDELLVLMADAALGPPPRVWEPADGWRPGMARWAVGVRTAYRSNPWALRIPISGPPFGPNNVAWLDAALRCLADTPLTEQQKLSTVLLVSGFVRNEATLTADLAAAASATPEQKIMPGYGATLSRLIGPDAFPALQRAIASGSLDDDDDLNSEFDFGLERILDGVAALIAS